jgi:molybdate transport system ATP-binding protein
VSLLEVSCRLRYPTGFEVNAHFATDAPITALFGPSGAGKTSILSIIAGLRLPDAGQVRLGNRVLEDTEKRFRLRPEERRIGYVFQESLLFPHLRVRDNLLYGRKRRPFDASSIDFDRVLKLLDLGHTLDRLPHTLSGGEKQRVALGRALLSGPELLLLDEPLGSIDQELKDRVLDYLEAVLQEWQIPTLFVSHSIQDVKRLAQKVVRINAGKVVEELKT